LALAAVPVLAWLGSLVSQDFSAEYQAFVDFYPIHRTCLAPLCLVHYGRQKAQALPALIDRFDWVVGHQGLGHDGHAIPRRRRGEDPATVFASPNKVRKVLDLAKQFFNATRSDRVLVLSGAPELTASEALGCGSAASTCAACEATVAELKVYFRAIFFESKDLEIDGVLAYPGGLTEMYLRRGAMEAAAAAIAAADIGTASKPRSVLASWGAFWPYIEQIDENGSLAWDAVKLEAARSRKSARAWSATSTALQVGVEVRSIPARSWWGELARYRFLVTPLGTSIYSPKTVEALMVLTVPIVRRGPFPVYDEMVRYGFPIVVVDEWSEITGDRLDQWWRELSRRVVTFRRHCLTTEAYWQLLTGTDRFCQ